MLLRRGPRASSRIGLGMMVSGDMCGVSRLSRCCRLDPWAAVACHPATVSAVGLCCSAWTARLPGSRCRPTMMAPKGSVLPPPTVRSSLIMFLPSTCCTRVARSSTGHRSLSVLLDADSSLMPVPAASWAVYVEGHETVTCAHHLLKPGRATAQHTPQSQCGPAPAQATRSCCRGRHAGSHGRRRRTRYNAMADSQQ